MEIITSRANALYDEQKALEAELDKEDEMPSLELFYNALQDYKEGFQLGDLDQKRLLLSSLIERILVNGKSVKVVWRL